MTNVRALRACAARVDADYARQEARAEAKLEEVRCACNRPHLFATGELIVSKGGELIGKGEITQRVEGGKVIKRLVKAPGGFVEAI